VEKLNRHEPPFPHIGGKGEKAHVAKYTAIQALHNAACVQNGNHKMLRNSGTVAVVKDMERILQALGEDGLNYLGYSYGTILGATFAALRPDLVKRMVLDGVSDSEAYFNDILRWGRSGMQDTHKVHPTFTVLLHFIDFIVGFSRVRIYMHRSRSWILSPCLDPEQQNRNHPRPYQANRLTLCPSQGRASGSCRHSGRSRNLSSTPPARADAWCHVWA